MTDFIAGVLLAAGGGRRLGGRPKALLDLGGRPLVEHAVRVLRDGGCAPVCVVLGAAADEVRRRARLDGCLVVVNPAWRQGMGGSLRAGLDALAGGGTGGGARAALVALVDQPGIGPEAVRRVAAAYESPSTLAAASYGGRRGHPVLLGAGHWAGVAASARGDQGARAYLSAHGSGVRLVDCSDVAAPHDVDTPGDLALLTAAGVRRGTGGAAEEAVGGAAGGPDEGAAEGPDEGAAEGPDEQAPEGPPA